MKINGMKHWNKWYLSGVFITALFGAIHSYDVILGAEAEGTCWLIPTYWFLVLLCVLGVAVLGWMLLETGSSNKEKRIWPLETIFLVASLWLGSLYLVVLPPLSAPDEISHYISAYQLSNHLMGKQANYKTGHVLIRGEDWFLEDVTGCYEWQEDEDGIYVAEHWSQEENQVLGQFLGQETYRTIHEKKNGKEIIGNLELEGKTAVSPFPPVVTTPAAYLPQAVGISIARILGLSSLGLAYLGRWMNLLFFAVMMYFAIKRMPFGKEIVFGAGLLPMTLHLAASFSYDVMILACFFLFSAWCLDLAYRREQVQIQDILLLAVLLAVAGPCKMVYAPLMGLCLLIPVKKFGGWRKWGAAAAVVFAAWAVSMALVNSQTIITYASETESVVPWSQEAGYSLKLLIYNPRFLWKMFYNTLVWQSEYYYKTMLGAYLGNVDPVLDVPFLVLCLMSFGLLELSLKKPGESIQIRGKARAWILFLCAACAGITMLSMLIAWTPFDAKVINGVQGRYFLPFLPLFLLCLKNNFVVLTKNRDRSILYLMCCCNGYILMRLFGIICLRI